MKILYLGLSSKFIHTMPAGWFLAEYLNSRGISVKELYLNVNMPIAEIERALYKEDFDTLLISVYIFNVTIIKKVIESVRKVMPCCRIIAGGPEADAELNADHIISGEGERALYKLLTSGGKKLIFGEPFERLDDIPSPYTAERIRASEGKLLYYESSRGCPFKCDYCFAGGSGGVRYFSLQRVYEDLGLIAENFKGTVKFTDRTFNADRRRAGEILRYILENFRGLGLKFHFEIAGDLLNEELINLLNQMPSGLIQIEAGVQTLNEKSLKAVNRVFNTADFTDNITRIISQGNVHTHLDLIAGLPEETLITFKESFNTVLAIRPHTLQLGFLKFLKGTPIRENFSSEFSSEPPYEVISTPDMPEENFDELKIVEYALDRLYNSGKFVNALALAARRGESLYQQYLNLGKYLNARNASKGASLNAVYAEMLNYLLDYPEAKDYLKLDFLLTDNCRIIPASLRSEYTPEFKRFIAGADKRYFYQQFNYLPGREKGLYTLKLDYSFRDAVTGLYSYEIICSS